MEKQKRPMHISCIMDAYGGHQAAWLAGDLARRDENPATSLKHYVKFAQACEAAKMDFLFIADFPALPDGKPDHLSRSAISVNVLEPLTTLSALAASTSHIGFVGTVSTSYFEPYNVARMFASLDHLSGGRCGWNVVTTRNRAASYNFGKDDLDDHDTRYVRAAEFVDVVTGLWDSWDDDAFVRDVGNGRYFDPEKLHTLNHSGQFFTVKGPLNISRSPQGRPVITQAGGSEPGKELAAETADAVFNMSPNFDIAKAFYSDLKSRLPKFGRGADDLVILCGITLIIGDTEAEAQAKCDAVSRNIHEDIGRQIIAGTIDVDLSDVPYDSPIPLSKLGGPSNKGQTYGKNLKTFIDEGKTLREIAARFAEARVGSLIKGTVAQVADHIQAWYEGGACDGFMLRAMNLPENLDDICLKLMPELQRRGLARTAYPGTTLRDSLGLARAKSRYEASPQPVLSKAG